MNNETHISHKPTNELFRVYTPVILRTVQRYKDKGLTHDELVQLGRIGLLNAAKKHGNEQGWRFTSWVYTCIFRTISRELQYQKVQRKHFFLLNGEDDLELLIEEDQHIADEYLSRNLSLEAIRLFQEAALKLEKGMNYLLNERLTFILCRFSGFNDPHGPDTLENISKILNVTRSRVQQLKENALAKLNLSEEQLLAIATAHELLQAQL